MMEEQRTYTIGDVRFPSEKSCMGDLGRKYFFNGTRNFYMCMVNYNQVGVSEEMKDRLGTAAAWIPDLDSVEMIRVKGTLYFKNE